MAATQPMLAVFASDKGPGDAERSSIMTQAGMYFARHGARIVCVAENGVIPVPLLTAARGAGGSVQIIADASIAMPRTLADVAMEIVVDKAERMTRVATLADAFVALPGSLASASALFGAWSAGKALGKAAPVVMLNRHRAFEVMRGYAADVLSPGLKGHDRAVQFADSVEDLWSRVLRLIGER